MPSSSRLWSLVVPVKRLARAKTRLAPAVGDARTDLALAFAVDTVTVALACPAARSVVVVTDDETARHALARLGAIVVADLPDAGLNPALRYGAQLARDGPRVGPRDGPCPVAALSADLPALTSEELAVALDDAAAHDVAFVADAAGTGTVLYAAHAVEAFAPAFGPGSAVRHRAAGAYEVRSSSLPGLRRDVDTMDDLARAAEIGLGPATVAALTRMARATRSAEAHDARADNGTDAGSPD